MKSLSIIGSGWLGLKVIEKLITDFKIKASYRSQETKNKIEVLGAEALEVSSENIDLNIFECDVLLINVPPKIRVDKGLQHLELLKNVVRNTHPNTQVIYCNSTGIYPSGENLSEDKVNTQSAFYEFEQCLRELSPVILRLGGLVAEDRLIIDSLLRKDISVKGNEVVNFVHRDDVVEIIAEVIDKQVMGKQWNVVSPEHPNKKELYTHWAKALTLSTPKFSKEEGAIKMVNGSALQQELDYKYKFPNPLFFWDK